MARWAKPYVATALYQGTVRGSEGEQTACFEAERSITRAEASVMLSRMLSLSSAVRDEDAPTWAAQAVGNMQRVGGISVDGAYSRDLTRAEMAVMLSAAMDVLEGRSTSKWLR